MEKMNALEWQNGRPDAGRVFAAVYPHSDDFTFCSLGLIIKLIHEGYTGYLIRLTDDCMDSYDLSYGETGLRIEQETERLARHLGIAKTYHFNYNNHYLGYEHVVEIRHRLIMLFRFLKVDTVITFDPFGHYEENPDHQITGMAVDQACWMSGRQLDLPEIREMGLMPQFISDRYYSARGPQEANCLIDLSPLMSRRAEAIRIHRTPLDNMWKVHLERDAHARESGLSYEDFVEEFFVRHKQEPYQGFEYYEKYRHVRSYPF